MKIVIFGAGFVGLSLSTVLSTKSEIKLIDSDVEKINELKNKRFHFKDNDSKIFKECIEKISFYADDSLIDYSDIDFVILAVPTNYSDKDKSFDTSIIDDIVKNLMDKNGKFRIVIKSTLPIGHTARLNKTFKTDRIMFSPEFLREGHAIHDNLHPSRIVIGSEEKIEGEKFLELLLSVSKKNKTSTLVCSPSEAESIKLFSNSYLAMRVAFFNELDSFALEKGFDPLKIINGVCLDERIGNFHNNPSLGYGGYCLPKDSKQLEASFADTPQKIISSIIQSNFSRKEFLTEKIKETKAQKIGFFKLAMKKDSDNFREAAILDIIEALRELPNIELCIFEPLLKINSFNGIRIEKDITKFKQDNDLIVANRMHPDLETIEFKLFCRDLFGEN